MAALGKIRSKGLFLICVIGLGLFAFIAEELVRSCESTQNDQRQQSHRQELVENIAQGVQMRRLGGPGDDDHHHHCPGNPHGAGRFNQRQEFVYQKSNQQNIQIIRPLHSGQLVNETLNGLHKRIFPFYVNLARAYTRLWYSNLLSCLL